MHRQISNAVPLPVGHTLGWELREALFTKWIALVFESPVRSGYLVPEALTETETG